MRELPHATLPFGVLITDQAVHVRRRLVRPLHRNGERIA
jgi:hypothetical protein